MKKNRGRAPRKNPVFGKARNKGLVAVFSGKGKGKTSAAMGVLLRVLGHGGRAVVIQFIKGNWESGEIKALRKFGKRCRIYSFGSGFTWETGDLKKDQRLAGRAWRCAKKSIAAKSHDLVVLDEILYAIDYGFLKSRDVTRTLRKKPALQHVILTGRSLPKPILRVADLVSHIRSVKHPYDAGFLAQKGMDY